MKTPVKYLQKADESFAAVEVSLTVISDLCKLFARATENDGELYDLFPLAQTIQKEQVTAHERLEAGRLRAQKAREQLRAHEDVNGPPVPAGGPVLFSFSGLFSQLVGTGLFNP